MRVPDPYWKTNPDWVADMSYQERYLDDIDDGPDEEDDYGDEG